MDMPMRLRRVGMAVDALPEKQQLAVIARFALDRDEKGRLMTNRQKAEAFDMSLDAYNRRWRTARKNLLKNLAVKTT